MLRRAIHAHATTAVRTAGEQQCGGGPTAFSCLAQPCSCMTLRPCCGTLWHILPFLLRTDVLVAVVHVACVRACMRVLPPPCMHALFISTAVVAPAQAYVRDGLGRAMGAKLGVKLVLHIHAFYDPNLRVCVPSLSACSRARHNTSVSCTSCSYNQRQKGCAWDTTAQRGACRAQSPTTVSVIPPFSDMPNPCLAVGTGLPNPPTQHAKARAGPWRGQRSSVCFPLKCRAISCRASLLDKKPGTGVGGPWAYLRPAATPGW